MVQILDFSEVEPQEKGNVRLIDSETDAKRELEITPEVVDRYKKALDNYEEVKSHDWNVHQTSTGFVETNHKAMMQSVTNCCRFFSYAPVEVVCNFLHCFITNISEIEE